MLKPLIEAQKDFAYAQGFLEEYLKSSPVAVKESLATLISGISSYRENYVSIQQSYDVLEKQYQQLSQQLIQLLELMRVQKERIDETEATIEEQKQYHV